MGMTGPQMVKRYGVEFKLAAVAMNESPGAGHLCIHPFMLSRWRKQVRGGKLVGKTPDVDPDSVAELARLRDVEKPTMSRALFLLLLAAAFATAQAQEPPPKPGSFCWPLHYGGLVLGVSQDKHVLRLLGAGAHRPQEGDGSRYFVDARRTMTLKVSTATDGFVVEILLEQGVNAGLSRSEQARAVSRMLDPGEGFGNWHALRLGASRAEVQANLGDPAEAPSPDRWVFNAACSGDLPQSLTLQFQDGKLHRVLFSAPPG